jgi:hypothetical protein
MMLDTFFIAAEACFDIVTVQLPVVDIESRMGTKNYWIFREGSGNVESEYRQKYTEFFRDPSSGFSCRIS